LTVIYSLGTVSFADMKPHPNFMISTYGNEKLHKYDKYAVALKTGMEVALKRTPVQILTFLRPINNLILVGEAPGVSVGKYKMVDVYTHLYDYEKDVSTIDTNGIFV
jgi:hypothetical protein